MDTREIETPAARVPLPIEYCTLSVDELAAALSLAEAVAAKEDHGPHHSMTRTL